MDYFLLVKEMNELIESEKLQTLLKAKEKTGKQVYTPSENSLEKLKTPDKKLTSSLYGIIQKISPFNYNISSNHYLLQVLEWQFPFSKTERERMNDTMKEKIINLGLSTIISAFRKERTWFLPENMMFYDEFEENKLVYLMNKGEEPLLFTEEEYDYLEQTLLAVLYEAARQYFFLSNFTYEEELSPTQVSFRFTIKFWLLCLRRFTNVHSYAIFHMREHLLWCIDNGILKEEKKLLKETIICPFTYNITPKWTGLTPDYLYNGNVEALYNVFQHKEQLKVLLKPEHYFGIHQEIAKFLKDIEPKLAKGVKLTQLIGGNNAQKSKAAKNVIEMIQCLPDLLKELGE